MSSREWYDRKMAEDPGYFKRKRDRARERMDGDPYKFSANKYSKQKSKAIQSRGLAWRLDKDKTIKKMAESTNCTLSNRTFVFETGHKDSPSFDRIDSNKGYTKSNVQIVTSRINQAKNNMTDEEFIQMCHDVSDYQRSKNNNNTTF